MISGIDPRRFCLVLKGLTALSLAFILHWTIGCNGSDSFHVLSGTTMGTTWMVKFKAPGGWGRHSSADRQRDLSTAIGRELEAVNNRMSVFREHSEISRFNRFLPQEWFAVSQATASLVKLALDVSRGSGGAFDVTVGPVIRLWGFGPGGQRHIPAADQIRAALAKTGSRFLKVRLDPPALRKEIPELECNLSALAKGHGVDRLAHVLEENGVVDYLVEIGGEVRARGERPGGGAWRIGVAVPSSTGGVQRVVALRGRAMATSGDYQNFFEVDGIRFSHTMDPRTGRPVVHDLASVTVVADTCMQADAWATALLVMGPEKATKLANQRAFCVFFIERTDSGYREFMTPSFQALLAEPGRRP